MSHDRRLTPATERIALTSWRDRLTRPDYTDGASARVRCAVLDLDRAEAGARDRQLLFGADVTVIEQRGARAFVQADWDGYCGWVDAEGLGPRGAAVTHRVSTPASQIYPVPDFKQREIATLSLGARLVVVGLSEDGKFAQLDSGGWVPVQHIDSAPAQDPVLVAEQLLGTPYLWGGNSRGGIDCSGLVQLAHAACGIVLPGDSDLQQAALTPVAQIQRGDMLFWPGHIALAVSPDRMIHATAFAMAVIFEDIAAAIARIDAAGEGPFYGARRLPGR